MPPSRDNVSSAKSDEMKQRKLRKEAAKKFIEAHREEVERTWMETRNKVRGFHYTVQEKKALKKWFETMDADGSGEISVEELEDPLISTGIAQNREDVRYIISTVDDDGSGEVGFEEFLKMLTPKTGEDAEYVDNDAILKLQSMVGS
eukprot:gene27159-33425_t